MSGFILVCWTLILGALCYSSIDYNARHYKMGGMKGLAIANTTSCIICLILYLSIIHLYIN